MTRRFFIDSEFMAGRKTIDLISIAVVRDDGEEYYAQSSEFKLKTLSPWVKENVLSELRHCPYMESRYIAKMLYQHKQGQCVDQQRGFLHRCPWRSCEQIRNEVKIFIDTDEEDIELWGYYCGFDFVLLSQLFGTFDDWPSKWPFEMLDIYQWKHHLQIEKTPGWELHLQSTESYLSHEHNALNDAKWVKKAWEYLNTVETQRNKKHE